MEQSNNQTIKIEYSQPKFWHRCMANLVDILVFVFSFFLLFIAARAIVTNNDDYKALERRIDEARYDSGLYIQTDDGDYDIISYVEDYKDTSAKQKKSLTNKAINKFFTYLEANGSDGAYDTLKSEYNNILSTSEYEGVNYFVLNGDEYIENESCAATDIDYYNNIYKPFANDKCMNYFVTYCPQYKADFTKLSILFIGIEFPASYLLAAILTWFVPPLFFRRGRKTLGKALYHIGLVDSKCYNPSFGRWSARFAIFLFFELILGIFSFGIPFIISFSLMSFSKKRQGFPDYMLGLTEVDDSHNKIYKDPVELKLANGRSYSDPVDFKMTRDL